MVLINTCTGAVHQEHNSQNKVSLVNHRQLANKVSLIRCPMTQGNSDIGDVHPATEITSEFSRDIN